MRRNFISAALFLFFMVSFAACVPASQLDIIDVKNASTIPSAIYPGDLVTLTFSVENISGAGSVADEIEVSVILNDNDFEGIKVSDSLGSIGARNSKSVSLRFRAKDSVLPGNYKIPVMVSYFSGNDKVTHAEDVSLNFSSCKVLKVDGINLSDSTPHIGDTLNISASIKNICSTAARNVSVQLSPVTNTTIAPFVVANGTTQKLGDIQPHSSAGVSFSVLVSDKVSAQAYVFSIDANCDECSSKSSNTFSFLVLGKPELVFSNIDYSVDNALGGSDKQIMQGSTFTLSIQLDNIGEEKAKAVEVSVDFGSGITGPDKSFLGNVNPDDSGAAVFNLSASPSAVPGPQSGTITVSFIDEVGERQAFTQQYSPYVNAQPPTSPAVYIIILLLVIVVLVMVYFILRFVIRQMAIRKAQNSR